MNLSDEQIAAWLHDHLDSDEAARVAAQVAADPELTRRADRLRRLDDLVRQAVPLDEALPDALLIRLGLTPPLEAAKVVDLAAVRIARAEHHAARPGRFAALASGSWRIAAQVLIVLGVGFGASMWIGAPGQPDPDGEYRTLSDPLSAAAMANALVIFDDSIDSAAVTALLAETDARMIGQPTPAGAWRLYIDPARRDAALVALRARPGVRMAEAIDGTAP